MIKMLRLVLVLWLALFINSTAYAQAEIVCKRDVIVQIDDWLSKLSEKFYGDVLAYPAIFEATNAKAAEDPSYALIEDEDLIEPGWKLCIVDVETAEGILGFTLDSAPVLDDTPVNLRGNIKIGAAQDLTGSFAEQGQSIRNGIELAVKEVNESKILGEGSLQVIWEDTAGDTTQAVQAFTKLIDEDQVVAILGPTLSKSAFAADPLAQAAGVPVIGSSNIVDGVTEIGSYIFRTSLPETTVISNTIGTLAETLSLEQVVMMYDQSNVFTRSSQEVFAQVVAELDIEVVGTIGFNGGDRDFSTQLMEIKDLEPDAVLLSALPEEAAAIMTQARQLDLPESIHFIGGDSFNSPAFLSLGGERVNGVISGTAWNVNDSSSNNRKFVTDYQAAYGSLPNQLAAQAYAAVKILAAALRAADSTDRTVLRDTLDSIEFVETPLGLMSFDKKRNPDHLSVIQVVENGEFVIFQ
jgi:branched-chain amino acid transport system substrate-binding protein